MANPTAFADVSIDIRPSARARAERPAEDEPFRALLIGDFSGRGPHWKPVVVDRDNFQSVLERLSPEIDFGGEPFEVSDLDHFHPDALYADAPLFVALRGLRKRLNDPATFAAAAAELEPEPESAASPSAPEPAVAPDPDVAAMSGSDLLDSMLSGDGGTAAPSPRPTPPAAPREPILGDRQFNAMIRKIVEPHVVRGRDPRQDELVARVDASLGEAMRVMLHDPRFQAVESLWRTLFFLIRRIETSVDLKLYILDVSKDALLADLASADDVSETKLHRVLVDEAVGTQGGGRWAVAAALFEMQADAGEIEALGRAASIAQRAGAALVAGAAPEFVGATSFADAGGDHRRWDRGLEPEAAASWRALRARPEAVHLGLIAPRFIVRQPYGEDSSEYFEFSEGDGRLEHESYLWAPPAAACVYCLAEAFTRQGWRLRPGFVREIDQLPVHNFTVDGEVLMQPIAEAWLTDEAAERMLERGVMPLLSVRGRDAIVLGRFQSVAEPAAPLAGPWG